MGIEWTSNLAVGIKEIDEQHKELYKKVNDFLDAMHKGKIDRQLGDFLKPKLA